MDERGQVGVPHEAGRERESAQRHLSPAARAAAPPRRAGLARVRDAAAKTRCNRHEFMFKRIPHHPTQFTMLSYQVLSPLP